MESIFAEGAQSVFSIAVAVYLLVRMEARLEELTEAITNHRMAISREERAA